MISFFPFIFGLILGLSFTKTLVRSTSFKPLTVLIDTVYGEGGDYIAYYAEAWHEQEKYTFCVSCDGAGFNKYQGGDSIEIWFNRKTGSIVLRDINPTISDLRAKYWTYLLFFPAGFLIYPFIILVIWHKYEKNKNY